MPAGLVMASAKEAAERTWEAWTDLRWDLASPGGIAQAVDRHLRDVPIMGEVLGSRISVRRQPGDDAEP